MKYFPVLPTTSAVDEINQHLAMEKIALKRISYCSYINIFQKQSVFKQKVFLEISQKLTGKHLCQSLFFNKLAEACNFIKKETLAQVFYCEFYGISKNALFYGTLSMPASGLWLKCLSVKYRCSMNSFGGNRILLVLVLLFLAKKFYTLILSLC